MQFDTLVDTEWFNYIRSGMSQGNVQYITSLLTVGVSHLSYLISNGPFPKSICEFYGFDSGKYTHKIRHLDYFYSAHIKYILNNTAKKIY